MCAHAAVAIVRGGTSLSNEYQVAWLKEIPTWSKWRHYKHVSVVIFMAELH